MSTRQLVSPSRSGSSRETTTVFQLQPPPHRYKENRRCRVLSKRDDDSVKSLLQASLVQIKSPLSPLSPKKRKGSPLSSAPLIGQAILLAADNEASSDADTVKSEASDCSARPSSTNREHGGIITSPVKGDVRNSAFFGEACVWSPTTMTDNETSVDKCLSASRTSSFNSIARTVTTFGLVRKRGSSIQSVNSPTQKQKSAQDQSPSGSAETAHTVLPMSPLSPLTLKTAPSLDTPAELHFHQVNTHLVLPICEHESEPLSATLKRLGAARKSMNIPEGDQESTDEEAHPESRLSGWEQILAERVANKKKASEASQANQEALQQAQGLFDKSPNDASMSDKKKSSRFSWLDRDPGVLFTERPRYSRIQSTARGVARRNLRSSISSMSTVLANHIFGKSRNEEWQTKDTIALATIGEDEISRPDPAVSKAKGDGWGGLRPRSSWFPNLPFGPLASPPHSPAPTRHLRPLHLLHNHGFDRDEWVDEVEQHEERECKANEEPDNSIHKLRVRFPSYLPKPSRDRHQSTASTNDSLIDLGTTVKYTKTSAEGRPTSAKQSLQFLRINGGLVLAFLIVLAMVAFVAVVGTQAFRHASSPSHVAQNGTLPAPPP